MEINKGFKLTEAGIIPTDWNLMEVCKISSSVSSGRSRQGSKFGDFPLYGSTGIIGYITKGEYSGDAILVARVGANAGQLNVVSGLYGVTDNTIIVKINSNIPLQYVWRQLELKNLNKMVFGSGQPLITGTQIKQIKIPVPTTRDEQEVIANALSDADAYIESLEKLIIKKSLIKKGVMSELLTGKRRLSGFTKNWKDVVLGDQASFYKGKGLPKSALTESGKYPCIHYGELFTQYKEVIKSIRNRTVQSGDTFLSQVNDVLMPTSDVTPKGLAKASCITQENVILGGDILVIRTSKKLSGSFLSYVIRFLDTQILQLVSGTTVFHIYASDMARFKFSMPEIDEQNAIVEILEDFEREIEFLENKLHKAKLIKQGMMAELLTGRIRLV